MAKKSTLLLGAHLSIEGGLTNALKKGESIGCTAIQIFTKSNRQWHSKPLTKEELTTFKTQQEKSSIVCVVAHASYLINLASPDRTLHEKSITALIAELQTCNEASIPFLVIHPGSYTSSTPQEGCKAIAQGLNTALKNSTGPTKILLETMAGQGTVVGSNFEELATIRELVTDKKRIGFCLDTCHVFSAGYDITTRTGYEQLWRDFDHHLGLSHLKVIHLNDSKKECASRVDRHEAIGKGFIGEKGFSFLMNDERFFDIPKILETPKANLQDDAKNMSILTKLLSSKSKKLLGIN